MHSLQIYCIESLTTGPRGSCHWRPTSWRSSSRSPCVLKVLEGVKVLEGLCGLRPTSPFDHFLCAVFHFYPFLYFSALLLWINKRYVCQHYIEFLCLDLNNEAGFRKIIPTKRVVQNSGWQVLRQVGDVFDSQGCPGVSGTIFLSLSEQYFALYFSNLYFHFYFHDQNSKMFLWFNNISFPLRTILCPLFFKFVFSLSFHDQNSQTILCPLFLKFVFSLSLSWPKFQNVFMMEQHFPLFQSSICFLNLNFHFHNNYYKYNVCGIIYPGVHGELFSLSSVYSIKSFLSIFYLLIKVSTFTFSVNWIRFVLSLFCLLNKIISLNYLFIG